MKKETIQREDITLVNIYAPNICKYVQQILMVIVGETDRNTAIAGYLNNLLTSMDRSSRQKINKESVALNNTLDEFNWYLQSILTQSSRIYILFKCTWNIF